MMNDAEVKRPILRYHGGKWMLAKWIISNFPQHRVYVEPMGGAASVLLRKPRSYAEVYNDRDGEVVNLFNVVRKHGDELIKRLYLTPFSKDEFNTSYHSSDDAIEAARRTIIRSFMGFGSGIQSHQRTGFRANSSRSGTTPAMDWINYPDSLRLVIERLRGVVIENKDWGKIVDQHDAPHTLVYLDPPYVLDTRYKGKATKVYKHEFTDDDHVEMCNKAQQLQSMCIISGYDNAIYNELLPRWKKVQRKAFADGAKERTEVLWISPNCL